MTPAARRAWLGAAIAAVLAAGSALWWRQERASRFEPPAVPAAPEPVASAPPAAPPVAAPPIASVPPPVPEPAPASEPLAEAGIVDALATLVGREALLTLLQTDDFAHRVVATVDNLDRPHASPRLWPVVPTAGRFTVLERDGGTTVDPDNAARYEPFVQLVERIDTRAAVDMYLRLLPLLQQAYEELGYPGRRFHSRLLEVLDHLLAAPPAPEPLPVALTDVRGPVAPERPWVRYEYVDPALQGASAGWKIMLRIGPVNERRLQAKLAEWRAELVRRAPRPR